MPKRHEPGYVETVQDKIDAEMMGGLVEKRAVRTRSQDERRPLDQRQRKHSCRARLTIPGRSVYEGDSVFTCNRAIHVTPEQHMETGRVRGKDGRVAIYEFVWWDSTEPREVWRTIDDTHTS